MCTPLEYTLYVLRISVFGCHQYKGVEVLTIRFFFVNQSIGVPNKTPMHQSLYVFIFLLIHHIALQVFL